MTAASNILENITSNSFFKVFLNLNMKYCILQRDSDEKMKLHESMEEMREKKQLFQIITSLVGVTVSIPSEFSPVLILFMLD